MSLTTDQIADLLFKKYLGLASNSSLPYFSEKNPGRTAVYPSQIWADYDSIPITAAEVASVVTQVIDLELIQVPGSSFTNAFYHPDLKDAIPFNFDPSGSYVPTIKKSDNTIIPVGQNDWFLDAEAGTLMFFGGLPSGVGASALPKVTFWKYIGTKGASGGGGGGGAFSGSFKDFMSGQIEYPTVDNVYHLISNNPSELYLKDFTISLYSGEGTASLKVDNNPVVGMSNLSLNSLETTYTSSFSGGDLVPTGSKVILELNNMSVGAGRLYFSIGMIRSLEGA